MRLEDVTDNGFRALLVCDRVQVRKGIGLGGNKYVAHAFPFCQRGFWYGLFDQNPPRDPRDA